MQRTPAIRLTVAALAAGAAVQAASATNVDFLAFGDQLAGGRLTITWIPGPGAPPITRTGPIFVGGVETGMSLVPDPFGNPAPGAIFRMSGRTDTNHWILENLADAFIIRAEFDLNGSISLFDDGSLPSTPGSDIGLNDVQYVPGSSTAPPDIFADEFMPWGASKNTGDMFLGEFIEWAPPGPGGGGYGPGQIYTWNDDTDIIPAPGSVALLEMAGLFASRRRRA